MDNRRGKNTKSTIKKHTKKTVKKTVKKTAKRKMKGGMAPIMYSSSVLEKGLVKVVN